MIEYGDAERNRRLNDSASDSIQLHMYEVIDL